MELLKSKLVLFVGKEQGVESKGCKGCCPSAEVKSTVTALTGVKRGQVESSTVVSAGFKV